MAKFKNREISEEILNNFIYDEDSPTCLIWKTGDRKGKYAGCIPTREDTLYVKIMIAGVMYLAHRIIWTMFNGPIPKDMVIDHLDRNPSNNRLSNLQLKTTAQNFRNRKKSKKNTSGVTGVSAVKDRKGVVYAYKAIWMEEGKQREDRWRRTASPGGFCERGGGKEAWTRLRKDDSMVETMMKKYTFQIFRRIPNLG